MRFISQFTPSQAAKYRSSWLQIFILGLLLVILGAIAISAAVFTTLLTTVFLGGIIFFSGIIILFDAITFWWRKTSGLLLHLLLAALYLYVGYSLIRNPVAGAITVTFLLGVFYTVAGIFRLGFYSAYQGPRWGWGWFNGIITLLIGVMILTQPALGLIIIGIFVGVDLIFAGWAYLSIGLAAKYFEPSR